jgi:hypothetical protein
VANFVEVQQNYPDFKMLIVNLACWRRFHNNINEPAAEQQDHMGEIINEIIDGPIKSRFISNNQSKLVPRPADRRKHGSCCTEVFYKIRPFKSV